MKQNKKKVGFIKPILINLLLGFGLAACTPSDMGNSSTGDSTVAQTGKQKKPGKLKDSSVITMLPGRGYYTPTHSLVQASCFTISSISFSDNYSKSEFSSVAALLNTTFHFDDNESFSINSPTKKFTETLSKLQEYENSENNLNYTYYARIGRSVDVEYDQANPLTKNGWAIYKRYVIEGHNPQKFFSLCGDRLISKFDVYGDIAALLQFHFDKRSDKVQWQNALQASFSSPLDIGISVDGAFRNQLNKLVTSYGHNVRISTQAMQDGGIYGTPATQFIPSNTLSSCDPNYNQNGCLTNYFSDLDQLASYFAQDYQAGTPTEIPNEYVIYDHDTNEVTGEGSNRISYDTRGMLQTGKFQLYDEPVARILQIPYQSVPESLDIVRKKIYYRENEALKYQSELQLLRNNYQGLDVVDSLITPSTTSMEYFIDTAISAFKANLEKLEGAPYSSCFDFSVADNESKCLTEVPKALDKVNQDAINTYIKPLNQKLTDIIEVRIFKNQNPTQTGYLSFYPRLTTESTGSIQYLPNLDMDSAIENFLTLNVDLSVPQEETAAATGIFGNYHADDTLSKKYNYGVIANCRGGGFYKLYLAKNPDQLSTFSAVCNNGGSRTAIVKYTKVKNPFYMDPVPAFK